MIHIVTPVFRMSVDQNQVKCEKQLVASQERHRVDQDPNNDCAHVRQKNDLIITLPTGPALEGFICEVSGRLPAGCPKKIWIDKLKPMEKKGQISGVMDVQEYGIYCFGIINKVFLPASMQELSAYESVYVIAFLRASTEQSYGLLLRSQS
ncbi:9579_t:CDS:2 [Entrophospora sp. SA101]|nr:9579_t:CDS:2 [Entrophospora sp. SA101]